MLNSDKNKIQYDFLVIGNKKAIFEKEINDFYKCNHVYYVPSYKSGFFKTVHELKKFYNTIGKKYDYIYLNTCSTTKLIYCYPYCKKNGTKIVSHSHNGKGTNTTNNRLFRPILNKISYKKFACSDLAAKWLFGEKNCKDCIIVNNGINTEKFRFKIENRQMIRKQYNIEDDCLLVGHVGRFMNQKNHSYLIDIFKEIKEKEVNSKLILIGTGELENDIKNKVKELNLTDSVIFAGAHIDVSPYYCAMDVFVLPSLYEGLPIVGVEAECSGLNCFYSDTITKQLKLTDKCHFLSINSNPEEWAKNILLSDKQIESRIKIFEIIKDKKFDINDTATYISNVFLTRE